MSSASPTSAPDPQGQGTNPTQTQPPEPPKPVMKIWKGDGTVTEAPSPQNMEAFFNKIFGHPIQQGVSFGVDQNGVSLSLPGRPPQIIPLDSMTQDRNALHALKGSCAHILSGSSAPLPGFGQPSQQQQQQTGSGTAANLQQQQTGSGTAANLQQQQQIGNGSANNQNQQAATHPDSQIAQLIARMDLLQQAILLRSQQQPMYIPQPFVPQAGQPPAVIPPVADDPHTRAIVAALLQAKIPILNRIKDQIQGDAQNQLNIQISQIQLNGLNARTLPQLHENRDASKNIVFAYLEDKLPVNMLGHLQAQIQARAGQLGNNTQNNILTYLLTNPRPARPNIDGLDDLLAVYEDIEHTLNQYLQTEITTIGNTLNQHLQKTLNLAGYTTELTTNPTPNLSRLIAIDTAITTALGNELNTIVQNLQNSTQSLNAPFNFITLAPAAAANPFSQHTRAELLQEPVRIVQQFRTYLNQQITLMPAHLRPNLPAVPAPAVPAAPGIDPLNLLTPFINTITDTFKNDLDGLPEAIRALAAQRPNNTFAALNTQYQAIQQALVTELQGKINEEPDLQIPPAALTETRTKQRNSMLVALGINPPAGTIQALQFEIAAAPSITRLIIIKTELDKYLKKQESWGRWTWEKAKSTSRWTWKKATLRNIAKIGLILAVCYAVSSVFYHCGVKPSQECLISEGYDLLGRVKDVALATPGAVQKVGSFARTHWPFGQKPTTS